MMLSMILLRLLVGGLLALVPIAHTLAEPTSLTSDVELAGGPIHGSARDENGVLSFKGLPFAAPPVGTLRWKPPQPVQPWKDVRDATEFGARCWSAPVSWPYRPIAQSEDCLMLNVWTAARNPDERRPVMVFIHGGGFQFGSTAKPTFDGGRLAQQGVILVTITYRLGVFGFLAHPDLDREGSASGNFGLQDQIAALAWIRENVAQFGGDPDNVTVFGESAGAISIGLLMTSPLVRGLFHKAIGQSGAFLDSDQGSMSTSLQAREQGVALSADVGASGIEDLRAIPADRLNSIARGFYPSLDGYVLPEDPAAAFANGRQVDVPLLAGWNDAEYSSFMSRALPHATAEEFREAASRQFGPDRMADFLKVYPAGTDAEAAASAAQLVGDLMISQQTWEWLGMHRETGSSAVYGYQYGYASLFSPVPAHAAEVRFVFGFMTPFPSADQSIKASAADRSVSARMMAYWTNFARAGNPNGPGLPVWPRYMGRGSNIMRFGVDGPVAAAETGTQAFRFIESFRRDGRLPESWRTSGL
jgi:para-nitrobenzyl esterase